jgi:hypothetical protein
MQIGLIIVACNVKKRILILTTLLSLITLQAYGAAEYVTVIKVLQNDDKGIIERRNGERWLIEKGVGAISFWRYEGKKILIYSPGMFCGVGSKVILSDDQQEARIWNAEQIESGVHAAATPRESDADVTVLALAFLGHFDQKSQNAVMRDAVAALKAFQKASSLPVTGKISADTQLALSKAVSAKKPQTQETLALAMAERLISGGAATSAGTETFITGVSSDGSIVKLGDGSVYEIDVIGQIKTMLWLPAQRVLKQSDGLLHIDKGQKVRAMQLK